MLRRLRCLFGHRWAPWREVIYSPGAYDQESWQERRCLRCGRLEQRDWCSGPTLGRCSAPSA